MGLQFGSTNLADIDTTDGLGLKVEPDEVFAIDRAEAAAAAPFVPDNGAPWWANILTYGAGRWIDNGFTTTPRIGNYDTGGGAGWNGLTYTNRAGNQASATPYLGAGSGVSPLLLIGGAVLLGFVLLRSR